MDYFIKPARPLPLALAIATLALTACGGGGSDDDDPETTAAISGKVLGSLVEGAIVCVDENENGRCDSTDEFRIVSQADGSFRIPKVPAGLFDKPLVVEVPMTAMVVDPVSGAKSPVATEYRLNFPPSDDGDRYVSSLSTLVNSEFLKQGDLDSASNTVAERLADAGVDIDDNALLDDYVTPAAGNAASADDILLYNFAKLAGRVMQVGQQDTAGDTGIDAAALMTLVAQKVFDNIDTIESTARNNQALIDQAAADAIVEGLAETRDLAIGEADIEAASQLVDLPFDLGPVDYANLINFREGNAAAAWRRVNYIRFETPGGADGRDVHDYRSGIPVDYEMGIVDANGDLQDTVAFDAEQWQDGADPQYWYAWEDEDSVFAVYTRAAAGAWDEGEYRFVLCPEGCADGARIHLADAELAPYDQALDIGGGGNFAALDALLQNDLQFIASDDEALRDGDRQLVSILQPSPPHGSTYQVYLGVDDDSDGEADDSRSRGTTRSLNRLFVPSDWIDQPRDFVGRISHRDRVGWENVSWEARTAYMPVDLSLESSFPTEELFDVYRAEIRDGQTLREGLDSEILIYLAEGNPLVGLAFEDAAGDEVATVCLPDDLPTSQQGLAGYYVEHYDDGSDGFFSGCQNFDLFDEFGVDSDNGSPYLWLEGRTSYSVDEEVLIAGFYLVQDDSNNDWGEPGERFQDMKVIALEFQDGSTIRVPTDLVKPTHDFSLPGDAAVEFCSVGDDNLRINWTPPGWMQAEFTAGELSVNLRIRARDENGSEIGRYNNRTRKGAVSTVVSKSLLENLADPGETIDSFRIEPYIGDMDYYDWKHRTYWARYQRELTPTELLSAAACQ